MSLSTAVLPPSGAVPTSRSLLDLGSRLSAGDPAAIDDCYRELGGYVRRYVARSVSDHEVDDVTQRVFYEVWRARERYDPTRSLRAWVIGIARKRVIDCLRQRPPRTVPLEFVEHRTGVDGREIAARLAWAGTVRDALRRLTCDQRAVIELAYFDGYSQTQIASLLGVPLGTVKSRSARSLALLAQLLAPAG